MAEGGVSPASVSQKKKTCPKCCVAGKWKAIKQHFELMPGHKENQNQYQKAVECGQAFFGEQRMSLVEDASVVVEQAEIEGIVWRLGEGNIGSDNRMGMGGSLNRISVICDPKKPENPGPTQSSG